MQTHTIRMCIATDKCLQSRIASHGYIGINLVVAAVVAVVAFFYSFNRFHGCLRKTMQSNNKENKRFNSFLLNERNVEQSNLTSKKNTCVCVCLETRRSATVAFRWRKYAFVQINLKCYFSSENNFSFENVKFVPLPLPFKNEVSAPDGGERSAGFPEKMNQIHSTSSTSVNGTSTSSSSFTIFIQYFFSQRKL